MNKKLLIISIVILAGLFAVGFYMMRDKENPLVDSQPQNENQPAQQASFSVLDDKQFLDSDTVESYKLGTAEFKIYPLKEDPTMTGGWFEAINNGQRIFASNPNYRVAGLLTFEFAGSKYVVIRDFSGGAHCCDTDYLFRLSDNNNLKLIKTFDMGNGFIVKDSLVFTNNKLYFKLGDDRFAYFHVPYSASYMFVQYYELKGDQVALANQDFKEELIKNAKECETSLSAMVKKKTNDFEEWFVQLLCYMANYMLAGQEETASQGFDIYFKAFSGEAAVKDSFGTTLEPEKLKKEIFDSLEDKRFNS